ncbi:SMI1/KNR4 family protein [Actinomadura algeriensis]|uniref:Knr4/Smi1-like domain-containing protein n=1 Tax=Actinomadura algeriensis TaxID=1679523 RepID=A0ABR9K191_9ACTN|nr:SMI1/KNR4 family protein [Actinomadura algeriensis]MBE1536605.1 hypothetical protein [Actinomadura algeriensis]
MNGDLQRAGRALASSIRAEGTEPWRGPLPGAPEDYAALLAATGPGILAGVLRLLVPGTDEERYRTPEIPAEARLWGVFASGETCWWLPVRPDPAEWLIVLVGRGHQQLNITTAEFLTRWLDGRLDLPTLSLPPVRRERVLTSAAPGPVPEPEVPRDPLAQLKTVVGPGTPEVHDWDAIESDLGTKLPADYKKLQESFSDTVWNGFFVAAPKEVASDHEFHRDLLEDWCDDDRPEDADPDEYFDVFPAPGGLLYCASTEGRDVLCWDTRDPDPDLWPVVRLDFDGHVDYGCTITELLVDVLTGCSGMTSTEIGDPATWAWPMWGPDPAAR